MLQTSTVTDESLGEESQSWKPEGMDDDITV